MVTATVGSSLGAMGAMGDPGPPDVTRMWSVWSWAPVADSLLILASVAYVVMLLRARRDRQPWPVGRQLSFLAGVLTLVIVVDGSVATYSHDLFWVHMIAHLLLIMVAPVAFVWAAPWRLLDVAGGQTGRRVVAGLGDSLVWRFLTSPVFTVPLYTAVLVLTHLTGFQQAMHSHVWIHAAETLLYLATGYLLFLPLVGSEATVGRIPYLVRFAILAVTMGVDTLVGVVLMLTDQPLAPGFAAMHPGWGPGALADQQTAGAVMWLGGDGLMMLLMIITAIQWGSSSPADQGLGASSEGIRRRELLGDRATDLASFASQTATEDADVDVDQQLLDAYNARLAAPRPRRRRPRNTAALTPRRPNPADPSGRVAERAYGPGTIPRRLPPIRAFGHGCGTVRLADRPSSGFRSYAPCP